MRERVSDRSRDLRLAGALAVLGAAFVGFALTHGWNPQDMSPGIEGVLVVGVAAPLFALLHGIDYPKVVALHAPIYASLFVSCRAVAGPALPVLGVAVLALALFGVLRVLWLTEAAAREAPASDAQEGRRGPSSANVVVGRAQPVRPAIDLVASHRGLQGAK